MTAFTQQPHLLGPVAKLGIPGMAEVTRRPYLQVLHCQGSETRPQSNCAPYQAALIPLPVAASAALYPHPSC